MRLGRRARAGRVFTAFICPSEVLGDGVHANHQLAEPTSDYADAVRVFRVAVDINQVVKQDGLLSFALLNKSLVDLGLKTRDLFSSALCSSVDSSALLVLELLPGSLLLGKATVSNEFAVLFDLVFMLNGGIQHKHAY